MDRKQLIVFIDKLKNKLCDSIKQVAFEYGITDSYIVDKKKTINNRVLNDIEVKQRDRLIFEINSRSYEEVIEEVTYTWFNRFIALRFMEVNGYLPTRVRVFTDEYNEFNPQILKEALTIELDNVDRNFIIECIEKNKDEDLYKYLLISQCNSLSSFIPVLFEKTSDYTELLFPNGLLKSNSILADLVYEIEEKEWKEQVQILGWIYEAYVASNREEMRKLQYITKKQMAAVNQVFTPDWIVKYMAENSLGRMWMESYPNSSLKSDMKYYIEDAKQDDSLLEKIEHIKYKNVNPEEILILEPCCGSGHILVYIFDLLYKMYEEKGYRKSEIPSLILEKNIFGLDIDRRASQLAYFSLLMKARSVDSRFFSRRNDFIANVYELIDSSNINIDETLDTMSRLGCSKKSINMTKYLLNTFKDAKVIGSALIVDANDYDSLTLELDKIKDNSTSLFDLYFVEEIIPILKHLCKLAKVLSNKYDVVLTNPPYSVVYKLEQRAKDYIYDNYPTTTAKGNFCSVFIDHYLSKQNGFSSMITSSPWMIQDSFIDLRKKLVKEKSIINMIDIGEGEVNAMVSTVAFVYRNCSLFNNGNYFSLKGKDNRKIENKTIYNTKPICISKEAISKNRSYEFVIDTSENLDNINSLEKVGNYFKGKDGLHTGDNERFVKNWHEVDYTSINFNAMSLEDSIKSQKRWFPYCKGGLFRQYYGNNIYVVNYFNNGEEIRKVPKAHGYNGDFSFKEGATWTYRTPVSFSLRYSPVGFLFDGKGSKIFSINNSNIVSLIGYLNSNVARYFMQLSPTTAYEVSTVTKVPFNKEINSNNQLFVLSKKNIEIAKDDWDSFEISWDFKKHPYLNTSVSKISTAHELYERQAKQRFDENIQNQISINKILIEIFKLNGIVNPEPEDNYLSLRLADVEREVKSFISYLVGCYFGRYSIDREGLIYAGGKFDPTVYKTISIKENNIIPIMDDDYFEDDLLSNIIDSIKIIFGEDTLEENLQFIANTLGGNGTSRDIIRSYLSNDFYKDHLKIYDKKPIYWMLNSGKEGAFKCLIYMHRYKPDLLATIRTDYIFELQERYRTQIENLEYQYYNDDSKNRIKISKQLEKIKAKACELHQYEEKIHHLADQMIEIDLNDGIKLNYEKFKEVLY